MVRGGRGEVRTRNDVRGMTRYLRKKRGDVIHKNGCPVSGAAHDWTWPDSEEIKDDAELRRHIEAKAPWLHLCKRCFGLVERD